MSNINRRLEQAKALVPALRNSTGDALYTQAADVIEDLSTYMEQMRLWQAEGEALMSKPGFVGLAFKAGQWWAGRPWRSRASA